jgi:methionyl-tRNA formyltransferase
LRIFIDGFGFVAHAITRKIILNHDILRENILVNTYNSQENADYLRYLKENSINHFCSSYHNTETANLIESFKPDYILSLYCRRIFPKAVLQLAGISTFNLHPSLLPDYKGCFSAPWVIINQETQTGITFHEMNEKVDEGKVLYQKKIKLNCDETGYSLYHKLASTFINEFDNFFVDLLSNSITPSPSCSGGRYFPRKVPHDGIINPAWGDDRIEAFIRAMFFPFKQGAILRRNGRCFECSTMEEYLRYSKKS